MSNNQTIMTLPDYMQQADHPLAFLFRGVTRPEHKLIPSVVWDFRPGTFPLRKLEDEMLAEFKRRAIPWLTTFVPRSDWEWLMLARHHGVPTRLLDWTTNPLVALYFACLSDHDVDGTVYVLKKPTELPRELLELSLEAGLNSFTEGDLHYVRPPHITPRIFAQASYFTVSGDPEKPLAEPWVVREIPVHKDHKDSLRRDLGRYGISEASLFPGLDGLGRDLKQAAVDDNSDYSMLVAVSS